MASVHKQIEFFQRDIANLDKLTVLTGAEAGNNRTLIAAKFDAAAANPEARRNIVSANTYQRRERALIRTSR
jgi:hypothetical protein